MAPDRHATELADGAPARSSRTVLFDKDGTLVEDVPYNVDPDQIRLVAGAEKALRRLGAAGYDAAVATNQSGVALGYFTLADLAVVRDRVAELLAEQGVALRGFYACPHHPRGSVLEYAIACGCRKPGGGLVRQAIDELGLDAATTWFVGDSWADVAAGRSAGCRTLLVGPEWRLGALLPPGRRPEAAVPDLATAIDLILDSGPSAGAAVELVGRSAVHGAAGASTREAPHGTEATTPRGVRRASTQRFVCRSRGGVRFPAR